MDEKIFPRPSEAELRTVLAAAENARTTEDGARHLAGVVLYLHQRVERLEAVLRAAERYLVSGHAEHEHAVLVRAVEAARRHALAAERREAETFGLE